MFLREQNKLEQMKLRLELEMQQKIRQFLLVVLEYLTAEVSDTASTTDKLHLSFYREQNKGKGRSRQIRKSLTM